MTEEEIYDAIDPQIKKKYNKRFVRSICAIDDLLEKKRYIYDTNETGKNGKMEQLINLLNKLHEENEDLSTKKEDAEYELLHLKEKYEKLLEFTMIILKGKDTGVKR